MRYGYSYRDLQQNRQHRSGNRWKGAMRRLAQLFLLLMLLGTIGAGALSYFSDNIDSEEAVLAAEDGMPVEEAVGADISELPEESAASAEEVVAQTRETPIGDELPEMAAAEPPLVSEIIGGPFHGPFLPPELVRNELHLQVGAGDTLSALLDSSGVQPPDAATMLGALGKVVDVNHLPLGAQLDIALDGNKKPRELRYEPLPLRQYKGTLEGNGWKVWEEPVKLETREAGITGVIKGSLFEAVSATGERAELAVNLASIFAWEIDFAKQTRPGDTFRVVIEKKYRDGEFWGYGDIQAAQYNNNGEVYQAFCMKADENRRDCYDEQGHSLRRAFLRAPLEFSRISSGFTHKRFHPVLKIFRPHEGVDYAAPVGTPVWAVADGVVKFVGYKGGNGKMVVLSHPNGYDTYYNHLSRFGRSVRKGIKVSQKQVIGYVGSTGLSTGPHLDYRIKKGGKFLNPLKVELPHGNPVPASVRGEFFAFRDLMMARLAAIDALAQAEPAGKGSGT